MSNSSEQKPKRLSVLERIGVGMAIVFAPLFLLAYCTGNGCEQAKSRLAAAEKRQSDFIESRSSDGDSVSRGDIDRVASNGSDIATAKDNVSRTCE